MSFLDALADPAGRYMLAYCLVCAIPWTLAIILYYRIRYNVGQTRTLRAKLVALPDFRRSKQNERNEFN